MIINESNKGNKYCVKFKIGDKVRFIHPGGKLSKEIATITGYDKNGFYTYTWSDGDKSNGSSDVNFKKINESKLDVSGIEVSDHPYDYQGFHGVTLKGTTKQFIKNFDHVGFVHDLSKKLGYEIEMSGIPGILRVNIGNKNFKDAYNDIKSKLNNYLNEDTVKKANGKWTNRGKHGEHGEFDSKKDADAQRRAMYANGYKG